jgi:hypothetical protein
MSTSADLEANKATKYKFIGYYLRNILVSSLLIYY